MIGKCEPKLYEILNEIGDKKITHKIADTINEFCRKARSLESIADLSIRRHFLQLHYKNTREQIRKLKLTTIVVNHLLASTISAYHRNYMRRYQDR